MIPDDYKHLSPDVLARIKPLTDEPETADPDQLAAAVILPTREYP